jgi:hypothetical protein
LESDKLHANLRQKSFRPIRQLHDDAGETTVATFPSIERKPMDRYPMRSTTGDFLRRTDRDSRQVQSMCLQCFATVARSTDSSYVSDEEKRHQLECPALPLINEAESA